MKVLYHLGATGVAGFVLLACLLVAVIGWMMLLTPDQEPIPEDPREVKIQVRPDYLGAYQRAWEISWPGWPQAFFIGANIWAAWITWVLTTAAYRKVLAWCQDEQTTYCTQCGKPQDD